MKLKNLETKSTGSANAGIKLRDLRGQSKNFHQKQTKGHITSKISLGRTWSAPGDGLQVEGSRVSGWRRGWLAALLLLASRICSSETPAPSKSLLCVFPSLLPSLTRLTGNRGTETKIWSLSEVRGGCYSAEDTQCNRTCQPWGSAGARPEGKKEKLFHFSSCTCCVKPHSIW